jgi:uncharacterized protein YbjT (DUF2867 family)
MGETSNTLPVSSERDRILLTGATGYVGGRLLRLLAARGHAVRCLARRPEALVRRLPEGCDAVAGDLLDESTLASSLEGCRLAYYLVHSMASASDFEEQDRACARNFARAAQRAGVERIVYLGGLGEDSQELSTHLRSRHEVGRILREHVPTVELRASIVVGSGSLSFELMRALVERLPVMITPRWVSVQAQPIAIADILAYLVEAIEPHVSCGVHEVGGQDVVTYRDLMLEHARQRGLRRLVIPVPLLTPRISSLWLRLVTPIHARVGRKLISSLRHETVVHEDRAARGFTVRPVGMSEAIATALRHEDREFAETRWSDALSAGAADRDWSGERFGSRLVDSRTAYVDAEPEGAFAPILRIGGENGWYAANLLWRLRGLLDSLVGGVGLRRGRRDPGALFVGDTVDFWRVEAIEPNRRVLLAAEMKLPGRAWLEFEVSPGSDGGSVIRQTASFDPVGLLGIAYWVALLPLHAVVFGGMLGGIVKAVRR